MFGNLFDKVIKKFNNKPVEKNQQIEAHKMIATMVPSGLHATGSINVGNITAGSPIPMNVTGNWSPAYGSISTSQWGPVTKAMRFNKIVHCIYVDDTPRIINDTRIEYTGNLHRENGPAIFFADGSSEWFVNDNRIM